MVYRKRILFFSLLILFFSCKKDQPADSPTVQISAPTGQQTFNVFDTITVRAHVTDPQGLKSISVYLANSQSTQVLPVVSPAITSNDMQISVPYVLSDFHMPGGQYYITVKAYNGTNSTVAYQQVNVNAAPTKRVAIYAITRSGFNTEVWKVDSLLHVSAGNIVPGDFSASDVNSYYQQLYIAAHDSGNINAYGVPVFGGAWGVTGTNSSIPCFTNVYSYGDAAYVSFYNVSGDGYVNYYNHLGLQQSHINDNTGYYPIKTLLWGNYLFVEEKNKTSNSENLVLYFSQSGLGYQQIALPGPLVWMCGMDNDHIFVFGNTATGSPYIMQYTISTNVFYSPYILPSAKLLSAVQLSSGIFLAGFNNGIINEYIFTPSLNTIQYISGANATQIRYDAVNSELVVATGKIVQEYSCGPTSGTFMASTTAFPDSVKDVQILFNK